MIFKTKRFLLFGIYAILPAVVPIIIAGCRPCNSRSDLAPSPATLDTALRILQDFVRAGDHGLGFADTSDAAGAYIDTKAGIQVLFALEDSFVAHGLDTNSILDIHRMIYFVHSRDGTPRTAITFDSTSNGWRPVEFSDIEAIRKFAEFPRNDSRIAARLQIIEAPFLQEDFLIGTAKDGKKTVVMTNDVHERVRNELPALERDSTAVPETTFVRAVNKLIREQK